LHLMEYSYLLDLVDECEDPHMRLVYAGKHSFASLSLTVVCVWVCTVIWDLCLLFATSF
jgi:hypothetical protein